MFFGIIFLEFGTLPLINPTTVTRPSHLVYNFPYHANHFPNHDFNYPMLPVVSLPYIYMYTFSVS